MILWLEMEPVRAGEHEVPVAEQGGKCFRELLLLLGGRTGHSMTLGTQRQLLEWHLQRACKQLPPTTGNTSRNNGTRES